jgi:hypothetical protein
MVAEKTLVADGVKAAVAERVTAQQAPSAKN